LATINRLTTAPAPASRVGQLQPPTLVLDGDFAPLYRYPNRPRQPVQPQPPTG